MRSRRFSLAVWALVAGSSGGCSILLHADADQCTTTSDCVARGSAFANHVCSAGTCVLQDSGVAIDAGGDTSTDVPVGTDSGSESGTAAEAGITCSSVSDCPAAANPNHPEVACDVDRHACVQLTTDECPFVIGDYTGQKGLNPIFVGAFATLPPATPTLHPSYLNYALAQNDFAQGGGIPAGSGSGLRMPAIVVCNDVADPLVVMAHLMNDVHTPAVVGALSETTLATTFSSVNLSSPPPASPVFFVNPFGADSTLTSLPTSGLLWSMLGQPSDLASAYAAFFPRVEAYVRTLQSLGSSTPMKVATVTSQSTDPLDLAKAVEPLLSWNGGPAAISNTANYLNVSIAHSTLDGYDLNTQVDVSDAVTQLAAFQPNVVISFGSEEFVKLIETLEIANPPSNPNPPHPFYLLSVYNTESTGLLGWIGTNDSRRDRLAGIAFASVADSTVLAQYNAHFLNANPDDQALLGAENYYDAMYFTLYSLIAAGRSPNLGGTNVAQGMTHLISPFAQTFDVGPTDVSSAVAALESLGNTTGIQLVGTLGPPLFNLNTGARESQGDVYCVGRNPLDAGATSNNDYFNFDVLRLSDAGASTDGGDASVPGLTGTFSCYGGM